VGNTVVFRHREITAINQDGNKITLIHKYQPDRRDLGIRDLLRATVVAWLYDKQAYML
jgi:hypothetical protein